MSRKILPIIACVVCGMMACTPVADVPATRATPPAAEKEAQENIIVKGHLICTATHTFFVPDAEDFQTLRQYDEPAPSGVFMWHTPPAESYFAFRSTYLPPVRSFMRVECADTVYELSYPWDEVCPVRAELIFDKKTGEFKSYGDYAPADMAFLKRFADEYNREVKAGIYKGLAGTPTTEDMRGKAVAADAEFSYADAKELGPHARRFIDEGTRVLDAAYKVADVVNLQERSTVRAVLGWGPYDLTGGHTEPWMAVDATGNEAKIVGTPYCLRYKQIDDADVEGGKVWKLYFEGTDGTCLELPHFRECHKLPFDAVYTDKDDAATMLYLAPDSKGLVVNPFWGADHAECDPIYVSWREGTPRLETPIRCCEYKMSVGEFRECFVGWKDNIPVTEIRTNCIK